MSRVRTDDRLLWTAFLVSFAAVAGASVLPVRPIVLVFPAWSLVVLGAVLFAAAAAVLAVHRGWPAGGKTP